MKSYWIKAEGKGTAFELRDVPVPQPGPGQVLIRMRATSLNRGEILASISRHRADTARPAGADAAGEIHAVGEGVTKFKPGDRVMARGKGTFAEYAIADVTLTSPMPRNLTWEQAGAVPIAYITAYECTLQLGHLKPGEWLLVAGVSSGVGVASLQIAKAIGARVVGLSGSADKLEKLKALGLDVGIQVRGPGFAAKVMEATGGKGANLAVNLVGGTAFPDCLASLANQGRLCVVGYVDRTMKAEIDLEAVHGMRLRIFGVSNAALTTPERAEATRGFDRDVMPALADGRIVPAVDRVFPFAELPAAKAYVESDAVLGKVVIRMD
jgi:NADPH:quinone reductase-like Zn-dependent oxidoreductase